jgi:hypothetical protein
MLDKIVKLRISGAADPKTDYQATQQAPIQPAPQQSGEVAVRVTARAPEGQCQLKLWDPHGRIPVPLEPSPWKFQHQGEYPWHLELPLKELNGRTLTWSARFFAPRPSHFELRVQVLHNGAAQPDGLFLYSGPLEASEVEERDGRFHFKVE